MASFPVLERKKGVKKGFLAPGANPSLPTNAKTPQLAAPGDSGSIDARNSTIDRELHDCIAGQTYKLYSFIYIDYRAHCLVLGRLRKKTAMSRTSRLGL